MNGKRKGGRGHARPREKNTNLQRNRARKKTAKKVQPFLLAKFLEYSDFSFGWKHENLSENIPQFHHQLSLKQNFFFNKNSIRWWDSLKGRSRTQESYWILPPFPPQQCQWTSHEYSIGFVRPVRTSCSLGKATEGSERVKQRKKEILVEIRCSLAPPEYVWGFCLGHFSLLLPADKTK